MDMQPNLVSLAAAKSQYPSDRKQIHVNAYCFLQRRIISLPAPGVTQNLTYKVISLPTVNLTIIEVAQLPKPNIQLTTFLLVLVATIIEFRRNDLRRSCSTRR